MLAAAAPAIDVHNHLGLWLSGGHWMEPDVMHLVDLMDELSLAAIVNLDGRWGKEGSSLAWILRAFEGVAACKIAKMPVLQGQ